MSKQFPDRDGVKDLAEGKPNLQKSKVPALGGVATVPDKSSPSKRSSS